MRIFLLFITTFTFVFSEYRVENSPITIEWLNKQPRSLYKDFYIWRYLGQNISANEAIEAMGQVKSVNNKILYRYIDKLRDTESSRIKKCMKMKGKELVKEDKDCIDLGLSVYEATTLNLNEIDIVLEKFENDKSNKVYKIVQVMNAPLPFTKILASPKDDFFEVFNNCGSAYRLRNLNYKLPQSFLDRISEDSRFYQMVKLITTDKNLKNLQSSLYNVNTTNTNYKAVFLLAINALNNGKKDIASKYFDVARKKAYYKFDIDNTTFWQYLITKDKNYLLELANSWDINIYSLYAKELLNIKPNNIIYNIEQSGKATPFDYTNPFEWLYVLDMAKKITDEEMNKFSHVFSDRNTLAHLAFVKEKYFAYKNGYFVTPFEDLLQNKSIHRKSLIYALGRQESRFIPTSISSSYAMGVMQIMPFLSKALAKQMNEPYNIDQQLDPVINIRYADRHLDFLEYRLKHPLFVSYAYNGGIGFTNRMLKTGLFSKKGEYEPFLSMELVNYDESKRYGKKVLANYLVYKNHFLGDKSKITMKSLFDALKVK